jgi:YD repeat-containing protein
MRTNSTNLTRGTRSIHLAISALAAAVCAAASQHASTQHHGAASAFPAAARGFESPPEPAPAEPSMQPSCDRKSEPGGMSWSTGELTHAEIDLKIPGRGLDFIWARKYRSRSGPLTEQGTGWDYSYDLRIEQESGGVVVHDGNTRRDLYALQPDGKYGAREFFREGEFELGGTFTLTFADSGTWSFRALDGSPAAGRIASISDRNGNTMLFAYDAQGRLTTITDTLQRNVSVAYDGTGHILSVTDFAGRAVHYAYYAAGDAGGSAGDLKSATTPAVVGTPNGNDCPAGKTTVYTYSRGFADERLNHNLLSITDASGRTWLTNVYSTALNESALEFDRVVAQTWGDPGDVRSFVYVPVGAVPADGALADRAVLRAIFNVRVGYVTE